jgi:hypothetical protein
MTEDERNAMFDECFEYDDHLRANGHFVAGEALQPPETALTLYWKNGKVASADGPYTETDEQLDGILVSLSAIFATSTAVARPRADYRQCKHTAPRLRTGFR